VTVIQKIIEIKPDRRLSLEMELPPDLPLGRARLQLAITPETPGTRLGGLREAVEQAGGAVALARQWRDEWSEGMAPTDTPLEAGPKLPGGFNPGLLPSPEELATLRREGRTRYPGKPFRWPDQATGPA